MGEVSRLKETRWKQRLSAFERAMERLNEACAKSEYSCLERVGVVKTFEFCFELAWNVLKDLLSYEGHDERHPRSTIRKSFEVGYINEVDCELLLESLDRRNTLSHVYKDDIARDAVTFIKHRYHPVLLRLLTTLKTIATQ